MIPSCSARRKNLSSSMRGTAGTRRLRLSVPKTKCLSTCSCLAGHTPMSPRWVACRGTLPVKRISTPDSTPRGARTQSSLRPSLEKCWRCLSVSRRLSGFVRPGGSACLPSTATFSSDRPICSRYPSYRRTKTM
ncbi:protein transporter SEC24 [Cryptococcus deuterogattii MMRL2647]|nr:protein transporter SEC24 [Cryptococcus deuterogattii MMRL2647]